MFRESRRMSAECTDVKRKATSPSGEFGRLGLLRAGSGTRHERVCGLCAVAGLRSDRALHSETFGLANGGVGSETRAERDGAKFRVQAAV